MKKIIDNVITVIAAAVFIWFAVSFAQINMHNRLGDDPMTPEQEAVNAFCIMLNIMDN